MGSWGCTWSRHMVISNPNLSPSLIVEGEVGEEKKIQVVHGLVRTATEATEKAEVKLVTRAGLCSSL